MKPWPEFPKLVHIDEAITPLLDVVRAAGWRFVPTRAPAPVYEGYDIGEETKAVAADPDEYLARPSSGGPLGTVLGRALLVAFQLGIEQGRRIAATSSEAALTTLTSRLPESARAEAHDAILDLLAAIRRRTKETA